MIDNIFLNRKHKCSTKKCGSLCRKREFSSLLFGTHCTHYLRSTSVSDYTVTSVHGYSAHSSRIICPWVRGYTATNMSALAHTEFIWGACHVTNVGDEPILAFKEAFGEKMVEPQVHGKTLKVWGKSCFNCAFDV